MRPTSGGIISISPAMTGWTIFITMRVPTPHSSENSRQM